MISAIAPEGAADEWRRWLLRAFTWSSVLLVVVVWRLGYLTLLDPDEAHYASITREMLAARELLIPLLDGAPYIDKPVFFHWLQGLSFAALGESELAARLPSACAAIVLLATTMWVGIRLFGAEAGERAGLMLATIPATFALSTIGVFDMLFTTFLFGGVGCLLVGAVERRRGPEFAGYLLLGLAVLTKGPVALVLTGLLFLGCLALPATRAYIGRLRWVAGLLVIVAVSAPWFLWMWWTFQNVFVEQYFLYANIWLFSRPMYRQRLDTLFYLRTFLFAFLPWCLVAVGRLVDVLRSPASGRSAPEAVLWMWTLAVIGFFTFSRFKLDTYIYPAAPAVCLIAAVGWQRLRDDASRRASVGVRIAVSTVPVTLMALGLAAALFLFDLNLPVSRAAMLLPIVLLGGGGVAALELFRRRAVPTLIGGRLIATLVAAFALVSWLGFPVLEAARPTPDIARWLSSRMRPDDRLAVHDLGKWRSSLRFYTNRHVAQLEGREELLSFFSEGGTWCVMKDEEALWLQERRTDLQIVYSRPAVIGSERGRVVRRQRWADVVVVSARPQDTTASMAQSEGR